MKPDPEDQEALNNFYMGTDAFIYDGMANHASPPKSWHLAQAVAFRNHPVEKCKALFMGYLQYDFPEMPALFHDPMSLRHLVQRK